MLATSITVALAVVSAVLAQSSSILATTDSTAFSPSPTATVSASTSASPSASAALSGDILGQLAGTATLTGNGITANFVLTYLDGQGTTITGTVSGLPLNTSLPTGNATTFPWHIHTNALLNSSSPCASALGHLDPTFVTDGVACSSALPQNCQEGDLSGKWGRISSTDGSANIAAFTDPRIRIAPQPLSWLGRSMVIHSSNGTRLACGNIISQFDGTANAQGMATNKSSTYQTAYPSLGPKPVTATYTPFVGTSTVSEIYALITAAATLPAISEAGLISITTEVISSTVIAGSTITGLIRPTAVVVSSSYLFSGQTALPTQGPVVFAPQSAGAGTPSTSTGGSAAPSGAGVSSTAGSSGAATHLAAPTISQTLSFVFSGAVAFIAGAAFVL